MGESVFVRGPGEKGDLAEDNEEVLRSQLYIGELHEYAYHFKLKSIHATIIAKEIGLSQNDWKTLAVFLIFFAIHIVPKIGNWKGT